MSDASGPSLPQLSHKSRWQMRLGVLVVFLGSLCFIRSSANDYLETQATLPLLFKMRQALGLQYRLSPRLKILVYDDSTLAHSGRSDLSISGWEKLLTTVAARKPRAIYIDKLFSLATDTGASEASAAAVEALRRLEQIPTKIVTAAFIHANSVRGRAPLSLDSPWYRDLTLVDPATGFSSGALSAATAYAYGPAPQLAKAFHRAGHVMNGGHGWVKAIYPVREQAAVPHFVFMGSDQIRIGAESVVVGDTGGQSAAIPVDSRGRVYVDFRDPKAYQRSSISISYFLSPETVNQAAELINEGDFVLVVPDFYTGHADFTATPLGSMPGAYVHASLLSSLSGGTWLKRADRFDWMLAGLFCVGVLLIFELARRRQMRLTGALLLVWILTVIGMFVLGGVILDLFTPIGAILLSALVGEYFATGLRGQLHLLVDVLQARNRGMQIEIDRASDIAKAFHPQDTPVWEGYEIATLYRPLMPSSGDWYALEHGTASGLRHIILCDIAGHGIQAAIVVSTCKAVLQSMLIADPEAREQPDFVPRYAKLLNATMYAISKGDHVASLVGVTLSTNGELSCICCGHPPPILIRKGRDSESTFETNFRPTNPLGIGADLEVESVQHKFSAGDRLLLFSDGARLPRGTRRLQLFLGDHWESPVSEIVRRIGDFRGERGDRGDHAASTVADDMTVIGIENTQIVSRQKVSNSVDV